MRRGERATWRKVADAAQAVAESRDYAEEYAAKVKLREVWATLCGIADVRGVPRGGWSR